MTPLRVSLCVLVVLLVVAPCLGFAAGSPMLHAQTKHTRHAAGHDRDASRPAWKTTPGTASASLPALVLGLAGRLSPPSVLVVTPPSLRPPFVPPRA
ncbi:MAG TPA: hypothetical protein VN646_09880 [Candidatus Acidoferrum sp.]|jgi:hypothetical protein|nr:hypothetical protein [Candidatus Acidoferrum sp.]